MSTLQNTPCDPERVSVDPPLESAMAKEAVRAMDQEGLTLLPMKRELDMDDIIRKIGPFGPFQIGFCALYVWCHAVFHGNNTFMTYGGIMPEWRCDNETNESFHQNCDIYRYCSEGQLTFRSQFHSIAQEWDLICDKAYYVQFITSMQMVGTLVGALAFGQVADIYGRKKTSVGLLIAQIILSCLSVLSPSWIIFLAFRILIGMCLGGSFATTWVLIAEFTTNKRRFLLRACATSSIFYATNQTLIAYFFSNWKTYSLVSNLQGIPLAFALSFVFESPRWLSQNGRRKEAMEILRRIAKINRRSHKIQGVSLRADPDKVKDGPRRVFIWELFRDRKLTQYTMATTILWFTAGILFYGVFLNIGNVGANVYLTNLLVGVFGVLELIYAFVDNLWFELDRRVAYSIGAFLAAASNFAIGSLQLYPDTSRTVIAVVTVVGIQAAIFTHDVGHVFSTELYPTLLRSVAASVNSVAARVGVILVPQIIFSARTWLSLPYVIFGSVGLASIPIVICFLPNTKLAKLPEAIGDPISESTKIDSESPVLIKNQKNNG